MNAPGLRILRADEARRMPWKNGGGETREYAVEPPGARLDSFAWRLSTADVAADGPFSAFPGVDRTLLILDGAGLVLTVADAAPVRLTPAAAPLAFPADVPTAATLIAGPVRDLNIMTRRASCRHEVRALRLAGAGTLDCPAPVSLLFCRNGRIGLAIGAELGAGDVAVHTGHGGLVLDARTAAEAVVIAITPAPRPEPSG